MDDNIYYSRASSDENWTCFGCVLPHNFSDLSLESASTLENSTYVASLSSSSTFDVSARVPIDCQWHSQYSGPDLDNEYSSDPRWFCVLPSSCVV